MQNNLIAKLKKLNSSICFEPAKSYYWSPKNQTVYFQENDTSVVGQWTLLHEVSHGLLGHKTYRSDFELVMLEVKAWEHAYDIAAKLRISIDDNHVQDCLDSYRDWQYKRSLCPDCDLGGVQIDQNTYCCLFCRGKWKVSEARFCRPYRRRTNQ